MYHKELNKTFPTFDFMYITFSTREVTHPGININEHVNQNPSNCPPFLPSAAAWTQVCSPHWLPHTEHWLFMLPTTAM